MNWGKEEDKLSPVDFEKIHNTGTGCRLELEDLGFCLGLDKGGKKVKLPIVRLKCLVHEITSRKCLEEKVSEK